MRICQVHQQTECRPVDAASDSDANDVADSTDMLQYVHSSRSQLGAADSQLIAEPMASSSSSSYKVFVTGSPGECVCRDVSGVFCGLSGTGLTKPSL